MIQIPRKKVQLPPEPVNLNKRTRTNWLNLLKNRQLIWRLTLLLCKFTLDITISWLSPNAALFINFCLLLWSLVQVVIEETDKE